MNLGDIEKKANEIISKLNLDKKDVFEAIKVASLVVIIYVVYKIWRKSRG